MLILAAVAAVGRVQRRRRVDFLGALLCVLGLGGFVFALIEQPRYGWSEPGDPACRSSAGSSSSQPSSSTSARAEPMLELELFRRRNFAVGNLETLAMYAGLAILFFFLVIYLQQVAGLQRAAQRPRRRCP